MSDCSVQDIPSTPRGTPGGMIVRLTLSIESTNGAVVADDCIIQADGESDDFFLSRAAMVLEFLRSRSAARVPIGSLEAAGTRHCDDYIEDESGPAVLREYLKRARSPGHGLLSEDPFPVLFASYRGKRVRVVMASRLGDVGINEDLQAERGYYRRVAVSDLTDFSSLA